MQKPISLKTFNPEELNGFQWKAENPKSQDQLVIANIFALLYLTEPYLPSLMAFIDLKTYKITKIGFYLYII